MQDESHQRNGWNLVAGAWLDGASIVPAIVAVLVFRLITYWLILVPGYFAYRRLTRQQEAEEPEAA